MRYSIEFADKRFTRTFFVLVLEGAYKVLCEISSIDVGKGGAPCLENVGVDERDYPYSVGTIQ